MRRGVGLWSPTSLWWEGWGVHPGCTPNNPQLLSNHHRPTILLADLWDFRRHLDLPLEKGCQSQSLRGATLLNHWGAKAFYKVLQRRSTLRGRGLGRQIGGLGGLPSIMWAFEGMSGDWGRSCLGIALGGEVWGWGCVKEAWKPEEVAWWLKLRKASRHLSLTWSAMPQYRQILGLSHWARRWPTSPQPKRRMWWQVTAECPCWPHLSLVCGWPSYFTLTWSGPTCKVVGIFSATTCGHGEYRFQHPGDYDICLFGQIGLFCIFVDELEALCHWVHTVHQKCWRM